MYQAISMGAVGIQLPIEEAAGLASFYGFKGIELNIKEVAQGDVNKIKDHLAELGLVPAGFGLPVDFRGDENSYQAGLQELPALAEKAAQLGLTRCSTYIFSWSDEMDFAANYAFHKNRLQPAAQILADHGICLGLEFLGPKTLREGHRYEFIHTMDGMLELCNDIGTGNMGLLLDCFHWYTAGHTVDDIKAVKDEKKIVYVHVNDAPAGIPIEKQLDQVRGLPGETGVIDIHAFLEALKDLNYTGPVVTEPFSAKLKGMEPEKVVKLVKESMDSIWI